MADRDVRTEGENIEGELTPYIANALEEMLPPGASREDVLKVGEAIAKMVEEGLDLEALAEEQGEEAEETAEPEDISAPQAPAGTPEEAAAGAPPKEETPPAPGERPETAAPAEEEKAPEAERAPQSQPEEGAPAPAEAAKPAEGAPQAEEAPKAESEKPPETKPAEGKKKGEPKEAGPKAEEKKKPAEGHGLMDEALDKFGQVDDTMADKLAEEEEGPRKEGEKGEEPQEEAPEEEKAGGKKPEEEKAPEEEGEEKKSGQKPAPEAEKKEAPAEEPGAPAGKAPGVAAPAPKAPRTEEAAAEEKKEVRGLATWVVFMSLRDIIFLPLQILRLIPILGDVILWILDIPILLPLAVMFFLRNKGLAKLLFTHFAIYYQIFIISHAVTLIALSRQYKHGVSAGGLVEKVTGGRLPAAPKP